MVYVNNEKKEMSKSLKFALVIIGVLLIIAIAVILIVIGNSKQMDGNDSALNEPGTSTTPESSISLPDDTQELLESYEALDTVSVTLNQIVFASNVEVSSGDKVSVYVYSLPQFVETFTVQEENGSMYINGLETVLKTMSLEIGTHHLVLVLDDQILGYVEITIPEDFRTEISEENPDNENSNESNSSNENTSNTKTETKVETENIPYSTEEISEVNMKRGERRVTQAGQVGRKEVTYRITYDESGKEISREKISEKIVVNPVNEKVLVGSSDYNINTDTYYFVGGHSCLSQDFDLETSECKGEKYSFSAINLKGTYYATCIGKFYTSTTPSECGAYGEKNLDNLFLLKDYDKEKYLLISDYKGDEMIFYAGLGDFSPVKITEEFCDTWRLACGSW